MTLDYRRIIRRTCIGALLLAVLLSGYFLNISLVVFQKVVTLEPAATSGLQMPRYATVPNARTLLAPIPYADTQGIYEVFPEQRFRRTIHEGHGNCSNLTFGMAYLLNQQGYAYQVVHFLRFTEFIYGKGHTVLNMPYQLDGTVRHGIVDVFEGGVPVFGGQPLSLSQLRHKHLRDVSILPLNARKDVTTEYYGEFLDGAVIGVVPQAEIQRYFAFLERVYVPLGNKKLERVFFSGLAIVLGLFPRTYVAPEDYALLFAEQRTMPIAASILLWVFRTIPLLLLATLLTFIRFRKHHDDADAALPVVRRF